MNAPHTLLHEIARSGKEELGDLSDKFKAEWLESPGWKTRNSAVKAVGLLQLREHADKIRQMLTDRTPAPLLDRILGGDFKEVGFIRRNAATVLADICSPDEKTAGALISGFGDPYWEVRTESLKSFGKLFTGHLNERAYSEAKKLLHDSKFEVIVEAVNIVGLMERSSSVINDLRSLYDHPNSLVRIAVIDALKRLYDRGIIADIAQLNGETRDIFVPGKYYT